MNKDKVHFIGLGGIGMSALAIILAEKGCQVSGSDPSNSYVTDYLKGIGVHHYKAHEGRNVSSGMKVVYSTAVKDTNPEIGAAKAFGNLLIHRSELLKEVMEGYKALAIAGTHGKTTTSGLLAHTLVSIGMDPSFAVGGFIKSLGKNGGYGKGKYFVAEADESDGSFLNYPAHGAIVTNIDDDHLDYWETSENLIEGFRKFTQRVENQNLLFWCYEDPILRGLSLKGKSYGFDPAADLVITNYVQKETQVVFDIEFEGKTFKEITLFGMGRHSVLNAAAVFGLVLQLGVDETLIKSAFLSFSGMKRRVDYIGEHQGALIFDDYGHHPTELIATIKGIRNAFPQKHLIVAFEPHRFSRTHLCWKEFFTAFKDADEVIITDVYGAGEEPIEGITAERLTENIQQNHAHARFLKRDLLASYFSNELKPGMLLLTLGAGGITKLGKEILALNQAVRV